MRRFEDKVVLITGAASGIGLATAMEFASEGAIVVATDINKTGLEDALSDDLGEGLKIETHRQDTTDASGWTTLVQDIVSRHGRLDVLFNNAGGGDFVVIDETTEQQLRSVIAVNLEGVFFGMQAAIRAMQENGGAIINNSSIAAMVGEPYLAAYAATKGVCDHQPRLRRLIAPGAGGPFASIRSTQDIQKHRLSVARLKALATRLRNSLRLGSLEYRWAGWHNHAKSRVRCCFWPVTMPHT
ncbi:SDR family NAD(P)-dependent oxidoreductase [Sulfitobacter aestuariivivens]|uniref:SDR family NAD(P)-dependent oxidoreductase n=1 Tax=Sulfitobacter aestuariivivens TaxID=2766981 RepID=UPI00361013DD